MSIAAGRFKAARDWRMEVGQQASMRQLRATWTRPAVMNMTHLTSLVEHTISQGFQGEPLKQANLIVTYIDETARCDFRLRFAWAIFARRAGLRFLLRVVV